MKLQKRECGIKMKIVPYSGGWTDVYINFGDEELYFIISYCTEDNFTDFMRRLYHLYPNRNDPEDVENEVDYVTEEVGDSVYKLIAWKTEFTWDEEGAYSKWYLERRANEDTEFDLHIDILTSRKEDKVYHYVVSYKELCYAVAKGYTEMIKKHGFMGYHQAVYSEDVCMRYFLFLKAYALDSLEMIRIKHFEEKGEGEQSSLEKELELMLFYM